MSNAFGKASAFKAVIWTTGSTYISYFLGLLASVLIARRLGVEDFGRYAYVVWLSGILVLIANNGLTNTAIKFVSEALGRQAPDAAAGIHGWLRRLQIASTVLTAVIYLLLVPQTTPTGWDSHMAILIVGVVTAFAFRAASVFNTSVAKGYGRFSIEAITNSLSAVFNTAFVVVLMLLHAPLEAYVLMIACTSLVYVAISAFLLRRAGISARNHHVDTDWRLRVQPHLMWTALMAAIGVLGSRSIETFLLNRWAGAADVGFFAIAMSLTRAGIDLLAAGLSSVMMPIMGYVLGTGDTPRMQRVFSDATRYYQFMGLLIAGVGLFWARVIVSVMYGEHYLPVVPIFRIMVATTGILLANGAFSALLASSDHQRFRVGVTLFSLVISWTVAITLIPKYGMFGAAYAQMISAVLYTLVIVIGIQKSVGLKLPWGSLAKQYGVALAAGGISLLVIVFGGAGTGTEIAAGMLYAALFLALSIVTGVWRNDEKRHLAELLRRSPYLARFAGLLILDAERDDRR